MTKQDYIIAARYQFAEANQYDLIANDCRFGSAAQQRLREQADDCRTLGKRSLDCRSQRNENETILLCTITPS